MAASSSGSRKWESKLKLDAADAVVDVDVGAAVVVDCFNVNDGEAGHDDVDICFGGKGT